MTLSGHPGLLALVFWPIIGAVLSYIIGRYNKTLRDHFAIFVTITTFLGMVAMAFLASNTNPPYFEWRAFMGFRIYFRLDGFRAIYGVITAFMWMMTTLFSKEYFAHYRNRNRYYFFSLITFGGTMGVFLSADLITTFLFFEIMSMASYVLVIHDEKRATIEAARTYMAVAVIGGLALLFGILLFNHNLGTTEIAALYGAMQAYDGNMGIVYLAAAFMMVGFGGKAGMFPLHIWLPNAHPVAPAPASALLSGVLTKTGVFGIIIIGSIVFNQQFNWGFIMLNIGVVGMFTGAILALFSTDLKHTLAYSSVSQIGFIILGVGMQGILSEYYSSLAIQGTLMHMVNHSLIKLLLFMAAGVVVLNVHHLNLNKIRGFGRGKPLFTFVFLMGVIAIIGVPFFSGYVSKTLLHESLVYHIWLFPDNSGWSAYFQLIEGIFTLTGGLTTAYMIKLFVCICLEKNQFNQKKLSKANKKYMTKLSAGVLLVCALILPILGVLPYVFMIPIGTFGQEFMMRFYPPYEIDFLAWINLRGAFMSLLIGVIIYTFIVRVCLMSKDESGRSIYVNIWPDSIDIEKRIYRPVLLQILPFIGALLARLVTNIVPAIASRLFRGFMSFRDFWILESAKESEPSVLNIVQDLSARLSSESKQAKVNVDSRSVARIAHMLNMRFSGDFMRIIFGSLAYSLLIFFVGFTIVQIIVFAG
ncbi:MAG: sodium:proton antiporter [Defluviitaleaceae bacterium]|nr:sodium:proton antiporter [Defluviitaleaceae bacterium]